MRTIGKSTLWNHRERAEIQELEVRRLLSSAVSAASMIANVPTWWQAKPMIQLDTASIGVNAGGSTTPLGLTPAEMRAAYGVDQISFANIVGDGTGQTIAIVDAYDDPNALSDLQAFDAAFGLPDPPSFQKLNQVGTTSPLPATDPAGPGIDTWEGEESLDIEWAHVIAPNANIILFEANTAGSDLYSAVHAASLTPGVSVVSMSWAGSEFAQEIALDPLFTTPTGSGGITYLASAGDSGAFAKGDSTITPNYPTASPNVVSVGGTTLNLSGTVYGSESGWGNGLSSWIYDGGGGGISQYETQPKYQNGIVNAFSTTQRVYPDVAMEADPATGVPIYDTFDF
ncbi:MAG TPA: S53 family peptidase, partial [Tepidisphaeraceae bacterium]|nr:S53 family peptidase [Tepidisphaeraceae bacterium]